MQRSCTCLRRPPPLTTCLYAGPEKSYAPPEYPSRGVAARPHNRKIKGREHRKVPGVTPLGARTHHEIDYHTLMFPSPVGSVGFFGAELNPMDEILVTSITVNAHRHYQ